MNVGREVRDLCSGLVLVLAFAVGMVWPFLVFGTDQRGFQYEIGWLIIVLGVFAVVAAIRWGKE